MANENVTVDLNPGFTGHLAHDESGNAVDVDKAASKSILQRPPNDAALAKLKLTVTGVKSCHISYAQFEDKITDAIADEDIGQALADALALSKKHHVTFKADDNFIPDMCPADAPTAASVTHKKSIQRKK